jgi:serine/threonine protein kinase
MIPPKDLRRVSGMGTPNEMPRLPSEVSSADDLTRRLQPAVTAELPPLPVDTGPVRHRTARAAVTRTSPPVVRPDDELIGRRCGGYVIEGLLGEGGMGKVYVASNPRMGKRVAVKVILPEHARQPLNVDRFLQEAKAAAHIDDPNIIDVLDASVLDEDCPYLIMPFVEGTSLEDLCEQMMPMPLDVAATILLQICGGLDAAHQHGIVHRDIKPHNILVGPRQQREYFVRIVDFGIAKLLDPQLAGKFKTQASYLMGTPGYMSPEQAKGESNVDARADVYAVAVVAYRMLCGRRPYMDDVLYTLLEKHATNAAFPRPRALRPDLPVEWDEAIMAALSNDRNQRIATVRELAQRLARGIPDGDEMLRMLVPRLAEARLPPNARTLDPFLDHDIARRAGSRKLQSPPRWRHLAKLAVAGLTLFALGGVTRALTASRSIQQPVPQPVSGPAPAKAASSVPEEVPEVRGNAAVLPADQTILPLAKSPIPEQETASAKPAVALSVPQPPGTIVVDVSPWAYVAVDGKRVGTTPYRGTFPPGKHRISISNASGASKVLTVTVSASKTTTVEETL